MKKILIFGATIKLSLDKQNGIIKKVFAQSKVFETAFDVYTWGFSDHEILYVHNGEIHVVAEFNNKMERRSLYFKNITEFAITQRAVAFYFRYASTDIFLLRTLRALKKNGILSVIEIPTYPYVGEFKDSIKKRLIYFLDSMLRGFLRKYVSKIVIFVENPKLIYGIDCIYTMNGIDCASISISRSTPSEAISLIAVASMLPHHGFDRLIEGMHQYYESGTIKTVVDFLVVGDGPELGKYQSLCDKYMLAEHISFLGQKSGAELDELFHKANIAVGSLGLHRIGLTEGSTLKNREYAVRGLPIVYSMYDLFLKDSQFALQLPSDDSPVDIRKIIDFWNIVQITEDLHKIIRNKAVLKCDMSITMEPVVKYLCEKTIDLE